MAKILNELRVNKLNSGLNVADSSVNMADSDCVIADNVEYTFTGGVASIIPPKQAANDVLVDGIAAEKSLGGCVFNGIEYVVWSNGTNARWMYKTQSSKGITAFQNSVDSGKTTVVSSSHGLFDGDFVTIVSASYSGEYTISNVTTNTYDIVADYTQTETGNWVSVLFEESSSVNLDPDAKVYCQVYADKLWFVNGKATVISGSDCVLCFIDKSDVMTGLTTAQCGLPLGLTFIKLHLQRIWVGKLNITYMTIVQPSGVEFDWDTSTAYSGADTAGYFIIDNNTEDYIQDVKEKFGSLVIYRRNSIWLLQGTTVLQMYITRQTNSKTGVRAKRSIAQAGIVDYFYSDEGLKIFNGQTVKEGVTNVDTISTDTLDRKIRPIIDSFFDKDEIVGYAFRDKYYVSDGLTRMAVYDEKTGGWSQIIGWYAENFIEMGLELYFCAGNKYYQFGAGTDVSMTSVFRTKDFTCDIDAFWKKFQKLILSFITKETEQIFTLAWHINGESGNAGSKTITIASNAIAWDTGVTWDANSIRWDTESIDFSKFKTNKLKSGQSIAFSLSAEGTNRFSLDGFSLLYETLKREV